MRSILEELAVTILEPTGSYVAHRNYQLRDSLFLCRRPKYPELVASFTYYPVLVSSGQNKVPIAERLFSDYSATITDFTAKSFRKIASIIAQPEKFSTSTLFYFRVHVRNN